MSTFFCFGCKRVKPLVSEIKGNINGYLNEIQYVEEKAEVKEKTVLAKTGELNKFSCYTECVADNKKYLKKQAFTLCRAADVGFSYGNGPRKTKAKNCESFKKVNYHRVVHIFSPDLKNILDIFVVLYYNTLRAICKMYIIY